MYDNMKVPLDHFNHNLLLQLVNVYTTFEFPQRLDTNVLYSTLSRMIEHEGWEALGARLKRDWKGTLHLCVPAQFSDSVAPLYFTTQEHDMDLQDHPLHRMLPEGGSHPSVSSDMGAREDILLPKGGPRKLCDYTLHDQPVLGVHCLLFRNATLLTFYWPHVLMDALGLADFLRAWQAVLHDLSHRPSPPPLWAVHKPQQELGRRNGVKLDTEASQQSFPNLFGSLGVPWIGNLLKKRSKRSVWIPRDFVVQMREAGQADPNNVDGEGKSVFLSDNDLVCAWFSRALASSYGLTKRNSVAVHLIHSQKSELRQDLFQGRQFVHNALGLIPTVLPADEVIEQPVHHLARHIRQSVVRLKGRPQIEAYAALQRKQPRGLWPMFGDRNSEPLLYTNWAAAKFLEIDVQNAVVGDAASTTGVPASCKATRYFGGLMMWPYLARNIFLICKDGQGNYVISGQLSDSTWNKVVEQLQTSEKEAP